MEGIFRITIYDRYMFRMGCLLTIDEKPQKVILQDAIEFQFAEIESAQTNYVIEK